MRAYRPDRVVRALTGLVIVGYVPVFLVVAMLLTVLFTRTVPREA